MRVNRNSKSSSNDFSTGVFEVISAYRSPETNEMLRRNSGGVGDYSESNFVQVDTGRVRRW